MGRTFSFRALSVTAIMVPPLRSTHSTRTVVLLLQQRLRVVVSIRAERYLETEYGERKEISGIRKRPSSPTPSKFHPLRRHQKNINHFLTYLSIDFRKNLAIQVVLVLFSSGIRICS